MKKAYHFNAIEHKCPCCGYEVECNKEIFGEYVKGDEAFIWIDSGNEFVKSFTTDKPVRGWSHMERVILLGCPKCKSVSFQFC